MFASHYEKFVRSRAPACTTAHVAQAIITPMKTGIVARVVSRTLLAARSREKVAVSFYRNLPDLIILVLSGGHT